MNADDFVGGHSILALERFMDETRHMIIFDVLSWKSPVGEKGERLRLFLSDVGYPPFTHTAPPYGCCHKAGRKSLFSRKRLREFESIYQKRKSIFFVPHRQEKSA